MPDQDIGMPSAGSRPAPEQGRPPGGLAFSAIADGDGLDRRWLALGRAKERPARWLTASLFSLAVLVPLQRQ
jgi:hypothetical protein